MQTISQYLNSNWFILKIYVSQNFFILIVICCLSICVIYKIKKYTRKERFCWNIQNN